MSSHDPIIVVTGGSAKIKLGVESFHGSSKRDYYDPNAKIVRVVVRDNSNKVLGSFDFPEGKFEVGFYGEEMVAAVEGTETSVQETETA
ncbi:MAG TPA: hypothetical protein VFS10_00100 [Pyrinomonadaceae bacterium]|nr:hypothetical protein [Pyrinomonadaceae bacterium]